MHEANRGSDYAKVVQGHDCGAHNLFARDSLGLCTVIFGAAAIVLGWRVILGHRFTKLK